MVSWKAFKKFDCVKVFEALSTLDPDPHEVNEVPQNYVIFLQICGPVRCSRAARLTWSWRKVTRPGHTTAGSGQFIPYFYNFFLFIIYCTVMKQ